MQFSVPCPARKGFPPPRTSAPSRPIITVETTTTSPLAGAPNHFHSRQLPGKPGRPGHLESSQARFASYAFGRVTMLQRSQRRAAPQGNPSDDADRPYLRQNLGVHPALCRHGDRSPHPLHRKPLDFILGTGVLVRLFLYARLWLPEELLSPFCTDAGDGGRFTGLALRKPCP